MSSTLYEWNLPIDATFQSCLLTGTTSISQEGRQRRVHVTETACLSTSESMETSANTPREKKNTGDLWRTLLCISVDVNIVITLSVSLSLSKRYIPKATTLVSYTRMWETLHDRPTTHRRPLHAHTRMYKHTYSTHTTEREPVCRKLMNMWGGGAN